MIVISLGGSRIIPQDIDMDFLIEFKKLILKISKNKSEKIKIICGGGITARNYQKALRKFFENENKKTKIKNYNDINSIKSNKKLDSIGILATKINALLVSNIFYDIKNVQVFSGTIPGHSTDYVATEIAVKNKAKMVINFSNIKYVYDKDPKKFKEAKLIKKMKYEEFEKQFGKKWIPGNNIPFDPKAISLAKKNKIKILFADSLNDIKDIIKNRIPGTIIY